METQFQMDELDSKNGKDDPDLQRRILIVEDNSDMRDFLRRVLARHGYAHLEAADGVEGMEIARRDHPDLILMDMSLPELDGFEATRRLKADETTQHVPIIAVTAHARPVDERRALEAGCDAYLSKPYSLREFLDVVQEFLPIPVATG
jgi:two-component system cell cycle response regulator DivK